MYLRLTPQDKYFRDNLRDIREDRLASRDFNLAFDVHLHTHIAEIKAKAVYVDNNMLIFDGQAVSLSDVNMVIYHIPRVRSHI